MSTKQVLNYQILEYIKSLKSQNQYNADNIDTVVALLEVEMQLDDNAENFKDFSLYPNNLLDVFENGLKSSEFKTFKQSYEIAKSNPKYDAFVDVVEKKGYFSGVEEGSLDHLKRTAKLIQKFTEKVSSNTPDKEEMEKQAEDLKFKGNACINSKDYEGAINAYTQALALSSNGPNSHVYYSNRAAAYCYASKHQQAIDDCKAAIRLSPDYVKAYSRLGLANFFLENYAEAAEAYEKAVELEPDNQSSKDSLRQARNKLKKKKEPAPAPDLSSLANMMGGGGAPPGMAGLMNNPAMKNAMDKVGGQEGLASLMKDPQMMAMAQQMMKDPKMMQQAMSMLGGGGGADGMPDMSALASMMGGGAGAGSNNSSSSGGKKPFKGFEE